MAQDQRDENCQADAWQTSWWSLGMYGGGASYCKPQNSIGHPATYPPPTQYDDNLNLSKAILRSELLVSSRMLCGGWITLFVDLVEREPSRFQTNPSGREPSANLCGGYMNLFTPQTIRWGVIPLYRGARSCGTKLFMAFCLISVRRSCYHIQLPELRAKAEAHSLSSRTKSRKEHSCKRSQKFSVPRFEYGSRSQETRDLLRADPSMVARARVRSVSPSVSVSR